MKKNLIALISGALLLSVGACKKESKINLQFSDKFEGKTVELVNYADSTVIQTAVVQDGKATFTTIESDSVGLPIMAQVMIDGRARAYYVIEPGNVIFSDSLNVAKGTPLNDKFSSLLVQLDSIENLDDMKVYADFALEKYNENKDQPLAVYFGIEWLKYADLQQIDSVLQDAPEVLRDSKRARHYLNFAKLRAATAPGMTFTDFDGEDAKGDKLSLSQFVKPGRYTVIDFWASWCPYCIKELPEMKQLYADFNRKGLDIVGVAVRDTTADTEAAVAKHEIPWGIIYNTQRVPYNIYGFSGIPHHILIGPDGKIISRGETVPQIRERIESELGGE